MFDKFYYIKNVEPRLNSAWKRVLFKLFLASEFKENFALQTHPDVFIRSWLPMWVFRGPNIGGDCADRRLRELRDRGFNVICKRHEWIDWRGEKIYTWIYKLEDQLNYQDWEEIIEDKHYFYSGALDKNNQIKIWR